MAVFALAGAEGLRDEGVETDKQAAAEEAEDVDEDAAEADGGDGYRAVGKTADHHGVDDGHGHPAEFGEDEREGQAQSGA